MPEFTPSAELNGAFYREVVEPIVRPHLPGPPTAALLGWGSDVLGYDTERSTDHGWGPRLLLVVAPDRVEPVRAALDAALPPEFRGWPVTYGWDNEAGTEPMTPQHFVETRALGDWLVQHLAIDPREGLGPLDWLLIPQQLLLGVVRGRVYSDPAGELEAVRTQLAWYPDPVWRWMLACQWRRLAQEEHLIGRAAQVGDEQGSRIAGARQVRELMRLAFLMERTYWPYTKWFGTAFAELTGASELAPHLDAALAAAAYAEREDSLCAAYRLLAERHNGLGLTEPLDPEVRPFHDRPFRVIAGDRFAFALLATVDDPVLSRLPMIGSVDQFADSTDVLASARVARGLASIYDRSAS